MLPANEALQAALAPKQDEAVRDREYLRFMLAQAAIESLRDANPVAEDRPVRQLKAKRAALFASLGNADTMRWTASCLAVEK